MDIIGPLQLRIMQYIWAQPRLSRSVTVHDVHDALNAEPDAPQLAYTTVLTVLRNLVRRKMLTCNPDGRNHRFTATGTRNEYQVALLNQICDDFFDGERDPMIKILAKVDND